MMIKDFKPRLYQETIFNTATKKNTLVVLPTGMGKTNIFLMLAVFRLKQYPTSKILFIGPTKPLIDQYYEVFKKHLSIDTDKLAIFTGLVKPEKRAELWKQCQLIFSTPQGLENDIISKRIDLKDVALLGIDEAHRSVGNYSTVWIAKQYIQLAQFPRIIGLTASPGSDMEKIKEVCANLFIEEIEIRTSEDTDVKPYIQPIEMKWVKVSLPPAFLEIQDLFKTFLQNRMKKLKKWGILKRTNITYVSKKDLLKLQGQLRGQIMSGQKNFVMFNAISVLAQIMKISHAEELLQSQGVISLYKYLTRLNEDGKKSVSKAVKNIIKDPDFKNAFYKTEQLYNKKIEHPKLVELQRIIEKEISTEIKIIVFNQYRENAVDIRNKLNGIPGVRAEIFVGQEKKRGTGLSQKEQRIMLDKFREGIFNVIVATSIGEEGLDIPKVDIVIFYEPVPSAIRSIQRRGRTGRQKKGRVIILMSENTRDEAYRWAESRKEKNMYKNITTIKKKLSLGIEKNVSLDNYDQGNKEKILVYVDHREKGSSVMKELMTLGADIKLDTLEYADYLLSSRVGVEFKTVEDFIQSIVDGRLLTQIKNLKEHIQKPVIVIEGTEDLYSIRNIHPHAIQGMIATIIVSYGIPVIQTKNQAETASLLYIIAKREQEEGHRTVQLHQEKPTTTLKQQQEYVVSSLPSIGLQTAQELLKYFKNIKGIVTADQKDLEKVPKIGKTIAGKIKDVVDKEYDN